MRHLRLFVVAAAAGALLVPAATARAGWSGPLATSPGFNFAPASGGAPWAVWVNGGGQLDAGRLTGAGWSAVGGSLSSTPASADIALDGDVPWVAWRTRANDVNVARLGANGSWEQVGTALQRDPATGFLPSVSVAVVAGRPWVAWLEADGDGMLRTRVSRLAADGATWEAVDPLDGRAGGVNTLSLAAIDGRAWIAWTQSDGGPQQVHVASAAPDGDWDRVWDSLNADPNCIAQQPSIAAVDERPWVAWSEHDCSGSWQVRVARLTAGGDAWEQPVGGTAPINRAPSANGDAPSLIEAGGMPWVGWRERAGRACRRSASRGWTRAPTGGRSRRGPASSTPPAAAVARRSWRPSRASSTSPTARAARCGRDGSSRC